MDVKLESRSGFLLATITGQVSLNEALEIFKQTCDAAAERGLNRILADFSAANGKLSDLERYELGHSMSEYYANKPQIFKVATVGNPPLINGFGAQVASNRGLVAKTFPDLLAAIDWLNRFSQNASDATP